MNGKQTSAIKLHKMNNEGTYFQHYAQALPKINKKKKIISICNLEIKIFKMTAFNTAQDYTVSPYIIHYV